MGSTEVTCAALRDAGGGRRLLWMEVVQGQRLREPRGGCTVRIHAVDDGKSQVSDWRLLHLDFYYRTGSLLQPPRFQISLQLTLCAAGPFP